MAREHTLPDGTKVRDGEPFSMDVDVPTRDDAGKPVTLRDRVQFPPNWLENSTPQKRAAMGITSVNLPGPTKDELRGSYLAEIKTIAGELLRRSDWQVIRQMELGAPIDPATKAFRDAVRARYEAIKAALKGAKSLAALQAVDRSFTAVTQPDPDLDPSETP